MELTKASRVAAASVLPTCQHTSSSPLNSQPRATMHYQLPLHRHGTFCQYLFKLCPHCTASTVHSGHFSRGKASIALCNDWNPSLAQSSDFHWPAELRSVRPHNLEQSTSFATSPRTVAEHLQAPAEDSACVNHRPAPL